MIKMSISRLPLRQTTDGQNAKCDQKFREHFTIMRNRWRSFSLLFLLKLYFQLSCYLNWLEFTKWFRKCDEYTAGTARLYSRSDVRRNFDFGTNTRTARTKCVILWTMANSIRCRTSSSNVCLYFQETWIYNNSFALCLWKLKGVSNNLSTICVLDLNPKCVVHGKSVFVKNLLSFLVCNNPMSEIDPIFYCPNHSTYFDRTTIDV